MKHNDTYGEMTDQEHDRLRQAAHPCLRCGMLAGVDPVFHTTRYGHAPAYRAAGGRMLQWVPGTREWAPQPDTGPGQTP